MLRFAAVSLVLVFATGGCKKEEPKPAPPPIGTAPASASGVVDGMRKIAITADTNGYKPDKITGKAGEKLMLVFTRTADASCISQLITPDKKTIDLPMNTPVEVAVTVPQSGEVGFACGMDMFHGTVVADPKI